MSATSVYLMIIGVSIVSLLPRILPIAMLSRFEFPEGLKKWLSFVAPAVLGALTALSIIAPQGSIDISTGNIYLWAFIPTFLVAIKSRSLFLTLVTGILTMALLYNYFGA
ncbi:MAG: AzlD domain-containing protein [Syntrophomonas sp.]|uniref:AzlD domain-containing protein n=1 Tax=Syntrophomonas sp. TaxID=2053627 RepID=UPI0026226C87|nr:AzlD domain-containing protein [Syntrophomonas sp.]MDD2510562.1 AzlD domain-containing protein [Syntrophomonas sp.]MDD3878843.1 AzlD domain-containing protein [Syntrophomonas sp.]MDD4626685.1 AzlD domain-containing protein [Syntrophomonas sp.]